MFFPSMNDDCRGGWKAYNELAWTDPVIGPPEAAAAEARRFVSLLRRAGVGKNWRILHLGSGAGIHDWTFKNHFRVTGVDISPGMLRVARSLNPESEYFEADIRSVRLGERFAAVVAVDSLGYLATVRDLRRGLETAAAHLETGGVFIFEALTGENFRENNFLYRGSREGTQVTLFEHNCRPDPAAPFYEAAFSWHVRRDGECRQYCETHRLGLFPRATWRALLKEAGFTFRRVRAGRFYVRWLMAGGEYETDIFVCRTVPETRPVARRAEAVGLPRA